MIKMFGCRGDVFARENRKSLAVMVAMVMIMNVMKVDGEEIGKLKLLFSNYEAGDKIESNRK